MSYKGNTIYLWYKDKSLINTS